MSNSDYPTTSGLADLWDNQNHFSDLDVIL